MNLVVALQFQGEFQFLLSYLWSLKLEKVHKFKCFSLSLVFDMGPRSTCELNYVEIIESDESLPSTKFCGSDNPVPYKAKSSQLKVHFKSSSNIGGTGWIVNFMAVHKNSIINRF